MEYRVSWKYGISIICCLFILSSFLEGQSFRFKNYGNDSNIPNGFVYTLTQDDNGYLWVGTGTGLSKFDGFNFYDVAFPETSIGRFPSAVLKDKNGTLWFGCNDGTAYYIKDDILQQVKLPNIKTISTLLEGPDGYIYIIPQGGSLFSVNPAKPEQIKKYSFRDDPGIISACFSGTGNLLLGTRENIRICSLEGDSLTIRASVEGLDYFIVQAIHRLRNTETYIIGTNGNGLLLLSLSGDGNRLTRLGDDYPELGNLSIQSISEDTENNLWISTNESGILQIELSAENGTIESFRFFNKNSGLPGNNIKLVFQDIEGNYWIGLFGDGLSVLNSLAFSFFSPGLTPEANNIIYISKIGRNYFLGTPTGYYLFDFDRNKIESFTDLRQKIGKNEIASYYLDRENNIWIGTRGGGLFVKNSGAAIEQFYREGNSSEDYITDIEVYNKNVWLGTLNGVIIIDSKTGNFKGRYNINNGLPHNSINKIYITRDGRAAIATKSDRLYLIDPEEGVITGNAVMYGTTMNEIISFCQTRNGNLWATTAGNGVFEFYGDSLKSITRADMLMSDYCYSILADSSDRIWIGHERGFSRFNRTSGTMRTYGTDFARGGICNPDAIFESAEGIVFIGTNQGLIVYDISKDRKIRYAPFNNINYVTINDTRYPYKSSYTLPYSKRYSIRVNYVGINLRDPEKVYYQTRLENLDNSWSKITKERDVPYSLGDGHYKFNMMSVNEDEMSQDTPVSFELTIKKPFWRTWWFLTSLITVITGVVILIVREREKNQKKLQAYLEKELDARTSVVMKQKGEIELQNIEITDSINYAKRIQTNILPDFSKLKETFSDAFILFRPRDIVSGDFYWFEKLENDKFFLVCADATGHGVPGAFMSMIGSTLLQDIVSRQHISKPSEVLKMLDNQIFSTLNQNVELGVSNDGMDMVACEISIKTRHIRFASAMRPVIIVLGGEPYYIKGNRSSIGGESVIEKYFDDQEYYLNEGDTIYMFSDGLPDQFGGTDGKKLKIARLKKLIEDVADLPMEGQKEVITRFYDEWKGSYDQVDDILLIGVRL
ncbi:MAG: SpoIIE family protein phosphatase [Bacteroidales bacterium]|jgi:ligand-binding sensor domain-containing protein/serine phosphatase RsbU (regulator of sigma subunit)|nr:SpoIIE family protein phosphatase [Bacteroidales bacterium]